MSVNFLTGRHSDKVRSRDTDDPEMHQRALELAETLMRHEISRRKRPFYLFQKPNITKFSLMVICIISFLIVLHSDVESEHYNTSVVQLGISTPLVPSIYRCSTIFLPLNLSSQVLDLLLLSIMFVHLLIAAFSILLFPAPDPSLRHVLFGGVGIIFVGTLICLADIGSYVFGLRLQRRSSSWASSQRQGSPTPVTPMKPLL